MQRRGLLLAGVVLAVMAGGARRATDERPLDARTYAAAVEALRDGRRDEAARLLRQLFTDFPRSPYAPRAILKVGEMLYPVTEWQQIGSASPESIEPAIDLFTRLAETYRSSHEAARALVRLGYLGLEPANAHGDLNEACGRFATAAQVYPDSEALDDAYFGSGMCEILRDRPARAAEAFSRLLQEVSTSPLADEALYRLGLALSHLDDPAEAMLTLQQVRTRYPGSRYAALALERLTLLHRLRLDPSLAPNREDATPAAGLYRLDSEYGAATRGGAATAKMMRGLSDIDIDPQGLVVVASSKAPGVFRLDARGKVQERITHPDPEYVAAAAGLSVFISGAEQIAVNTRNWSGQGLRGVDGRPPADWGPIAVDGTGQVHLLDRRANALLIYDRGRRLVGSVRPAEGTHGRFVDVAPGKDGGVFVLDGRARVVIEVRQGRKTSQIDLADIGVDEPKALAVDALGDLFVLDARTDRVSIADPTGRKLAVIRLDRQVQSILGDPSSIAVDARGRLYLAGRRKGIVVRYQ